MDYRLEQLRFELREDPSSRSFFKLGEHLRREGELDEAIEILSTGLKEHDHYVAAWVSLGRAQLDNGDAKEAQISLERSLQLDPENAVASRAMGEAAIVNDDWLTAVKALKRARGLSPQDDTLDERITFVEEHLSELGLLEKPAPVASHRKETPVEVGQIGETPGGEPFAVQSAGDTGVWDDANDVFAAGMVEDDEESETADADTEGDEPPPEIDDEATDDSGTYAEPPPMTEDEVASMVGGDEPDETVEPAVIVYEKEPHEAEGAEASESAFIAPEPASEPEMEQDSEAEPVFESDLESEPEDEPEPLPESLPDPEPDVQTELEKDDEGVPLPTMTLARLAIDQGDLDLAERTLRGVIEREPEHPEAAELLETLIAGPPQVESIAEPKDPAVAKVEALQRWLDAVRLASERLRT